MSGRRRLLVLPLLVFGVLAAPASAHAHPLGNFTINTSASLVLRADEVVVDYAVDMAEIPTFQERGTIDADGDGSLSSAETAAYRGDACAGSARADCALDVDGTPARLAMRSSDLSLPVGQAGLPNAPTQSASSGRRWLPAPTHALDVRGRELSGPARLARGHGRRRRRHDRSFRRPERKPQPSAQAPIPRTSGLRTSAPRPSRSEPGGARSSRSLGRMGPQRRRAAGSSPASPLGRISRPDSSRS